MSATQYFLVKSLSFYPCLTGALLLTKFALKIQVTLGGIFIEY